MIIAREKRKTNISEYILYMFQVEDLIRACDLDIERINTEIIQKFPQPPDVLQEMRGWYQELIRQMEKEGVQNTGHLQRLNDLIGKLNDLHIRLLKDPAEAGYQKIHQQARPDIRTIQLKLRQPPANELEVCYNALYGLLLLRLQKKKVSQDTEKAMATFSKLLALLSEKFKAEEKRG